jgi:hypothetical protein
MHEGFWSGNLRETDRLGELGVVGRIILKLIFRKWDGRIDSISLSQDRDGQRALVNAVIKFGLRRMLVMTS